MAVGLFTNDPRSPSTLAAVNGLWVCDRAGLRGTPGLLQPVNAAWVWSAGGFHQVWPGPPKSPVVTTAPYAADWRFQTVYVTSPGATSYSVTAKVGNGTPITIYTGSVSFFSWNWYEAGPSFSPGTIVTYEATALNSIGSAVSSVTATLPSVPAPTGLRLGDSGTSFLTLEFSQVPGAVRYEAVHASSGNLMPNQNSGTGFVDVTGLNPSATWALQVRAVVSPAYLGASQTTGPLSSSKTFTTQAAAPTGPANGTYTIKPSSNATFQWGESGGQSAQWRPTSDDLYHGDGGSVSTRGKQAAFFYYGSRFSSAFPSGLGSKSVTKIEIYMKRISSGGSSAATANRFYLHQHTSKPSGAPNPDNFSSATDAGSLAWGEGEWETLPDHWGEVLIAGDTWKGLVWGYVSSRYMIASNDLGLTTPNGTIRITIGS